MFDNIAEAIVNWILDEEEVTRNELVLLNTQTEERLKEDTIANEIGFDEAMDYYGEQSAMEDVAEYIYNKCEGDERADQLYDAMVYPRDFAKWYIEIYWDHIWAMVRDTILDEYDWRHADDEEEEEE